MPNALLAAIFASSLPTMQQPAQQGPDPAATAVNGLGVALYRQLTSQGADQNLFSSPFSIGAALAMVAEGARGETLDELRAVLHVPAELPLPAVHLAFARYAQGYREGSGDTSDATRERIATLREQLATANKEADELMRGSAWEKGRAAARRAEQIAAALNELLPQVGRYELRIANSLWVERTFPLVSAYAEALGRSYGTGAAQRLDFRGDPDGARRRINGWVAEHTNDRIVDLIPPDGVGANTPLVVANAMYFRGEWRDPFLASATMEEDFLLPQGKRSKVELMHDRWRNDTPYAAFDGQGRWFKTPAEVPAEPGEPQPQTYPDDRGFTMVELPYKGGELSMVVIAPRTADGLPHLESLLSGERLTAWLARLQPRTVDTAIPRWQLQGAFDLQAALQAAGVYRAFVPPDARGGGAQFAGISAAKDPAQQVFIGGVFHRAWIEVAEKGTEAAAATAIMMAPGAAMRERRMVPFTPVFRADRPFVFLIRDVRSGAILFLGRVVQPSV